MASNDLAGSSTVPASVYDEVIRVISDLVRLSTAVPLIPYLLSYETCESLTIELNRVSRDALYTLSSAIVPYIDSKADRFLPAAASFLNLAAAAPDFVDAVLDWVDEHSYSGYGTGHGITVSARQFADSECRWILGRVARLNLAPDQLCRTASLAARFSVPKASDAWVALLRNPGLPEEYMRFAIDYIKGCNPDDPGYSVLQMLVSLSANPAVTPSVAEDLYELACKVAHGPFRENLAANPAVSPDLLRRMCKQFGFNVTLKALANPSIPQDIIREYVGGIVARKLTPANRIRAAYSICRNPAVAADDLAALALSDDEQIRDMALRALGSRQGNYLTQSVTHD